MLRGLLRTIPLLPGPELYDIFDELRKSKTSLDNKIEKAVISLKETSDLISELESDLKERTDKLQFLRTEIQRYSQLVDIEEGKAKALLNEVQTTLNKGKGRERLVALVINLIAGIMIFLLGVFAGPKISNWRDSQNDSNTKTEQRAEIDAAAHRE
jgi:hypothetical protein